SPPVPKPESVEDAEVVLATPSALPWPFRNVSLAGDNYLAVRSAVLKVGVSSLQSAGTESTSSDEPARPPATMRSLMNEYLPPPRSSSQVRDKSDEERVEQSLPNQEHLS